MAIKSQATVGSVPKFSSGYTQRSQSVPRSPLQSKATVANGAFTTGARPVELMKSRSNVVAKNSSYITRPEDTNHVS